MKRRRRRRRKMRRRKRRMRRRRRREEEITLRIFRRGHWVTHEGSMFAAVGCSVCT
jgi:hypothetical protein